MRSISTPHPPSARRFPRWRAAALLALPLLAVGLSGCDNNPYPDAERREPLLYSFLGDDPKTLDPTSNYIVEAGTVGGGIYESFFQYHFLKQGPFELQLALGAELPHREAYRVTVGEGKAKKQVAGERWTFRIKHGLRFQDDRCFPGGKGREILASDFVHSFKRMADPALADPCPILSFLLDKLVGLKEYQDHQRELSTRQKPTDYGFPVPGLQLDPKDPYTFRVILNQPYPQLRYLMAMAFTTPLAPEATQYYGKQFGRHPVGEGPYYLAEWRPKQRLVLRRNPNHRADDLFPSDGAPGDRENGRLTDAGARLPLNEGMVFSVIREDITAWNLFQQGYLDIYGVSQQNYSQVVSRSGGITPEMAARGISLTRATIPDISYFVFNMKDPVYGGYGERQKKLRQAISLCWDAGAELNLFSAGLGMEAQWLVPPGVYSYDANYQNPYRQTNVARAKALLAEAGYPGGVESATGDRLELTYETGATDAAGRQFQSFLAKQLGQIGIRLVTRTVTPDVFQEHTDRGQFQFVSAAWYADYPDPENFAFLLYGPNIRPGPNMAAYDRPEYNRLFERMRAMNDGPERTAILNQMRAMAVDDCPWIFRSHDEAMRLAYGWIHNSQSHPIALDVFKYRRVDGERRARLRALWNRPNPWPLYATLALLALGSIPAVGAVGRRRKMTARKRAQS